MLVYMHNKLIFCNVVRCSIRRLLGCLDLLLHMNFVKIWHVCLCPYLPITTTPAITIVGGRLLGSWLKALKSRKELWHHCEPYIIRKYSQRPAEWYKFCHPLNFSRGIICQVISLGLLKNLHWINIRDQPFSNFPWLLRNIVILQAVSKVLASYQRLW